jgi:hypothetical protein
MRSREAEPLCEAFQQLAITPHSSNSNSNSNSASSSNYSDASTRVPMTLEELQDMVDSALTNTQLPPAVPPLSPSPNGWLTDDITTATAAATDTAAAATSTAMSVDGSSGNNSELVPVVSYGWLQWSADPVVASEQARALRIAARCAEYQRKEAAAVQELAELRAARRRRRSTTAATAAGTAAAASTGADAASYSVSVVGDSSAEGRQWRTDSGNSNSSSSSGSYSYSNSNSSGGEGTVASLEYSSSGDTPQLCQLPRQQLLLGPALLQSAACSSLDSSGSCSSECFSVHESSSIRQLSSRVASASALQQQQQQQQEAAGVSLFSWSMGEAESVAPVAPVAAPAAPIATVVVGPAVGERALAQHSRLQAMEVDELATVQQQQQQEVEQQQQQRRNQPLLCRATQHTGSSNWAVLACMFL